MHLQVRNLKHFYYFFSGLDPFNIHLPLLSCAFQLHLWLQSLACLALLECCLSLHQPGLTAIVPNR